MMAPGVTNPLSLEYRPGYLLSKSDKSDNDLQDIDETDRYLNNFSNKLHQQAEVYARLRKVGGKNVRPKDMREPVTASQSSGDSNLSGPQFLWQQFKNNAAERVGKIGTYEHFNEKFNQYSTNLESSKSLQKMAKFGVYDGWEYSQDRDSDANIFYLNNNDTKQRIKIHYDETNNKINITTNKEYMQDDRVMAIMLEIARNVQRYSGNYSPIRKINLSKRSRDQDVININSKLNKYANVLNKGVEDYFDNAAKAEGRPAASDRKQYEMRFR